MEIVIEAYKQTLCQTDVFGRDDDTQCCLLYTSDAADEL